MNGEPGDPPEARLHLHEVESMRRSISAGGSLAPRDIERLVLECGRLLAERVRIEHILSDLGPAWGGTKRALNDLHQVLRPAGERQPPRRR